MGPVNKRLSIIAFLLIMLVSCTTLPNGRQSEAKSIPASYTKSIILLDISGSMLGTDNQGAIKIEGARQAIQKYIDITSLLNTQSSSTLISRVGLVTFNKYLGHVVQPSENLIELKALLPSIQPDKSTNLSLGLSKAIELLADDDPSTRKSIILLSDGIPTISITGQELEKTELFNEVFDIAKTGVKEQICLYAIGFGDPNNQEGNGLDEAFLQTLSLTTGCGSYFNARESSELSDALLNVWHESHGEFLYNQNAQFLEEQLERISFEVPPRQSGLFITVESDTASLMNFELISPDKNIFSSAAGELDLTREGNFTLLTYPDPQPGQWILQGGKTGVGMLAIKISSSEKNHSNLAWYSAILGMILLLTAGGFIYKKMVIGKKFSFLPTSNASQNQDTGEERNPQKDGFFISWKTAFIIMSGIAVVMLAAILLVFFSGNDQFRPNDAPMDSEMDESTSITVAPFQSITDTPTPTITASPTPEGIPSGKIVFTCQVDKHTNHDQICLMNADGSGLKQLTNDLNSENFYPNLSADGSSIVFSSSRNGGFEIFEMNADGSNLHQLTSGNGECYAPEISPDGSKIVFTRFSGGRNTISMIDRDGSHLTDLNNYLDCKDPTWSPDGTKILFIASPSQTPQFFTMDPDGNNVQLISDIQGLRGRSDWGPEGYMASYRGTASNHDREIFLFNPQTSPQNLTSGGDNLAPSFSPDGRWVTFMSYRDHFWDPDGCEIYVMRLSDQRVLRLTSNDWCDYQPRWGP